MPVFLFSFFETSVRELAVSIISNAIPKTHNNRQAIRTEKQTVKTVLYVVFVTSFVPCLTVNNVH